MEFGRSQPTLRLNGIRNTAGLGGPIRPAGRVSMEDAAMLDDWLGFDSTEYDALLECLSVVLDQHAADRGLKSSTDQRPGVAVIRRAVVRAYADWWNAMPWWKAAWLRGSLERRQRRFVEYCRTTGILDKWVKRAIVGIVALDSRTPPNSAVDAAPDRPAAESDEPGA